MSAPRCRVECCFSCGALRANTIPCADPERDPDGHVIPGAPTDLCGPIGPCGAELWAFTANEWRCTSGHRTPRKPLANGAGRGKGQRVSR